MKTFLYKRTWASYCYMFRKTLALCSLVGLLLPGLKAQSCFLEENGQLAIEAEAYHSLTPGTGDASGSNWVVVDDANASDNLALETQPNTGVWTGLNTNGPRLDYQVYFQTAGTYRVYVRGSAPDANSDSFHFGLDGNALTNTSGYGMSTNGSWTWADDANDGQDVEISITEAGNHTLNIWMREDGVKIDKIVLSASATYPGPDAGPAASNEGDCGGNPDPGTDPAANCFVETGGEVVIETENYSALIPGTGGLANHSWVPFEDASVSGGTALRLEPNTGGWAGNELIGPRLDYEIQFNTPGTYQVWIRAQSANGNDDSFHAGIDGVGLTNLSGYGMMRNGPWEWVTEANDDYAAITFEITAPGTHTFNIWMREDGVEIDKITLTSLGNTPSGLGANESDPCPVEETAELGSLRANNWYFGLGAGLDFSSGSPVAVTGSAISTTENSATISDENGNLQFYTNGVTVWNKNNEIMTNGQDLRGHLSAAQGVIIVPQPGNPDIYYVFTQNPVFSYYGFMYSIVDMSLEGGLGAVTTKNVQIRSATSEKMAAARHANGTDVWLLGQESNNNTIYAYLLTSTGLNTTPVISQVGEVRTNAVSNSNIGCMKVSPDGTKIASSLYYTYKFEVLDFNNSTGQVSNPMVFELLNGFNYGIEFSPNSQLLYVSHEGGGDNLSQLDLSQPNQAAILASRVGWSSSVFSGSSLQLGRDGKIYHARLSQSALSVVEQPNVVGLDATYSDLTVPLGSGISRHDLPIFINDYFDLGDLVKTVCLPNNNASFSPFMGKYGANADAEYKALPQADGTTVLIGSGPDGNGGWDKQMVLIDQAGEVIFEKQFHTPDQNEDSESRWNHRTAAVATNDDVITAMEGRVTVGPDQCTDPIILRTDACGNVKFLKRYDGGGCLVPQVLRATPDNGVLMITTPILPWQLGGRFWLDKFNAQGDIVMSVNIFGDFLARDMKVLDDGSMLITGINHTDLNKIHLIKLDPAGTQLWGQSFQHSSATALDPYSVIQLSNQQIVVGGKIEENGEIDGFLLKTDSLGNSLGQVKLEKDDVEGNVWTMLAETDGYFIVGGGAIGDNAAGKHEPFLAKFSSNLQVQWARQYEHGLNNDVRFFNLFQNNDAGYLASGGKGNTGFPGFMVNTGAEGSMDVPAGTDAPSYKCRVNNFLFTVTDLAFSPTPTAISPNNGPIASVNLFDFNPTLEDRNWTVQRPDTCATSNTIIGDCPSIPFVAANPSDDQNYVMVRQPRIAVQEANDVLNNSGALAREMHETVAYFDGLGRPIQQASTSAAPDGRHVYSFNVYDEFGRETHQYLPYNSDQGTPGAFRSNSLGDQTSFFTNDAFPEMGGLFADRNFPFSETRFEPSPLDRVIEQGAPGTSWQVGAASLKTDYLANGGTSLPSSIQIYSYRLDPDPSTTPIPSTPLAGNYYIRKTTDENQALSYSVINKLGQEILSCVQIDANTYACTSYMYDKLGNVKYVLQPEGYRRVNFGTLLTQDFLNKYAFQYVYDKRNRVVEKKAPGGGWEHLVYNQLDQVVMSQDANQRAKDIPEWTFAKYDAMGRVVMTGVWAATDVSKRTRPQLENYFEGLNHAPNGSDALFESRSSTTFNDGTGSLIMGYSHDTYPLASQATVHSINYYDDYDFNFDGTVEQIDSYTPDAEVPINQANLRARGKVTSVSTRILGTNDFLKTVTFYDEYGHEIQTRTQNHLGGTDISTYEVNFAGEIMKTVLRHNFQSALEIIRINEFCYDHQGRQLRATQQMDDDPAVILSEMGYNQLGLLQEKNLGSDGQGSALQSIDYMYNVRGWMTDINTVAPLLSNGLGQDNDVFGQRMHYNSYMLLPSTTNPDALYNGNISGIEWQYADEIDLQGNTYTYDRMNRILSADYKTKPFGNLFWSDPASDRNTAYSYDLNGNIESLIRQGPANGQSLLDDLTYQYASTDPNRLLSVTDAIPNTAGLVEFKEGANSGDDYEYDANGNIIKDNNKNIEISYNHLNKPVRIDFTGGENAGASLSYGYDASGTKLSQIMSRSGSLDIRVYVNGFQYISDDTGLKLDFISHAEGRVVPIDNTNSYRYEYNLTDHLGNVRAMVADLNLDGEIDANDPAEFFEKKDYYAFGMEMQTGNGAQVGANPPNRFGYNGKELIGELDLHWSDYGARMYDASIGKWNGVDALANAYYEITPYAYTMNNPVIFIDPDGNRTSLFESMANQVGMTDQGRQSMTGEYRTDEDKAVDDNGEPRNRIVILKAPKGAKRFGHAAVLIGNEETGYYYFSKNGTTHGSKGPNDKGDDRGEQHFWSIEDFANSDQNFHLDEEGNRESETPIYTEGVMFKTDVNFSILMDAALGILNEDYRLLGSSCTDVCSNVLLSAGLNPGTDYILNQRTGHYEQSLSGIPNHRYTRIVANNKGTIIDHRLKVNHKYEGGPSVMDKIRNNVNNFFYGLSRLPFFIR